MPHRTILSLSLALLLTGHASPGRAGFFPDLDLSSATTPYHGPGPVVMFNVPDGSGSAFTAARTQGGVVDATVTLTLLDAVGAPYGYFPREDMWLESADGNLFSCPGGTTADFNTDSNGQTRWVSPLNAGGSSQAPTIVMISATALRSGGLPIMHNSTDINGDGVVNLTDVALFVADYYGPYQFRSDLHYDGVINLSDVAVMGAAIGVACP